MKKNSALAGFISRFQDILDAMDEFDMTDELEELNAQLEDSLFLLESIDENDEDAAEEIADALDEIGSLAEEYKELSDELPEILEKANELEMAVKMAAMNLK